MSLLLLLSCVAATAQQIRGVDRLKGLGQNIGRSGMSSGSSGGDSLQRRDKNADSITINFRYLDSTRAYLIDSSISDFTTRYPIPATHIYLSNTGSATRSILFSPITKPGWDPGFHSLDAYKFKLEQVRFFSTTRPYSELNYLLGARSEQMIELLHTQNIRSNWNFMFKYRLINSPGFFKNRKNNHNNYVLSSWYKSLNQRYNNYFIILGNKLQAAESGGLKTDQNYIDDPIFSDRYAIPTNIGGDDPFGTDFFSTKIGTSNKYSEFTLLMRQQYDFGRKDSIVTDSTVIPLFYPRLRFEHTFTLSKSKYAFNDYSYSGFSGAYTTDSAYYKDNYYYEINPGDSVYFRDRWNEIINDFSIYQFPDAKNQQQFIKLGAAVQNLAGEFASGKQNYYNVYGHAEYRNKTRDQRWDIEANGKLYFVGLNFGDYQAYASLQRYIGKRKGYLQLGFENVNRTPSFIFNSRSSFYFMQSDIDFKKENTTHFFASLYQPSLKLRLQGHYYLMTNYTYIRDSARLEQADGLFNLLQVSAHKTVKLGKRWNWHAEVYFQQAVGNAPVNVPLFYTRNRIAYEGNLGFKNLDIAFGTEIRYHTPYKADGYAPAIGQFYYQNDSTISNRPDIHLYMHFRIKGIKFYIRAENLNTARVTKGEGGGFGFSRNNFAAPGYALPGLVIRFGIFWSFVN